MVSMNRVSKSGRFQIEILSQSPLLFRASSGKTSSILSEDEYHNRNETYQTQRGNRGSTITQTCKLREGFFTEKAQYYQENINISSPGHEAQLEDVLLLETENLKKNDVLESTILKIYIFFLHIHHIAQQIFIPINKHKFLFAVLFNELTRNSYPYPQKYTGAYSMVHNLLSIELALKHSTSKLSKSHELLVLDTI